MAAVWWAIFSLYVRAMDLYRNRSIIVPINRNPPVKKYNKPKPIRSVMKRCSPAKHRKPNNVQIKIKIGSRRLLRYIDMN